MEVRASGIVGMNEKNGARARGDGAFQGLKIDEPAMGVGQGVGDEADVLEAGQEFEEGITGFGEKEFVGGIAEEAKGVGVGFAGAGGEEEGFGIDGGLVVVEIVAGDFAAGGGGALGWGVGGGGG